MIAAQSGVGDVEEFVMTFCEHNDNSFFISLHKQNFFNSTINNNRYEHVAVVTVGKL